MFYHGVGQKKGGQPAPFPILLAVFCNIPQQLGTPNVAVQLARLAEAVVIQFVRLALAGFALFIMGHLITPPLW